MADADDDIVRDGTRRVVGREALRRASRMVREWQQEEQEKSRLAAVLAKWLLGFAVIAALVVALRLI